MIWYTEPVCPKCNRKYAVSKYQQADESGYKCDCGHWVNTDDEKSCKCPTYDSLHAVMKTDFDGMSYSVDKTWFRYYVDFLNWGVKREIAHEMATVQLKGRSYLNGSRSIE